MPWLRVQVVSELSPARAGEEDWMEVESVKGRGEERRGEGESERWGG